MAENRDDNPEIERERQERREFLRRCGRFAAVTPPAMATLLVVSSVPKEAIRDPLLKLSGVLTLIRPTLRGEPAVAFSLPQGTTGSTSIPSR